jgi:hypothetical protein
LIKASHGGYRFQDAHHLVRGGGMSYSLFNVSAPVPPKRIFRVRGLTTSLPEQRGKGARGQLSVPCAARSPRTRRRVVIILFAHRHRHPSPSSRCGTLGGVLLVLGMRASSVTAVFPQRPTPRIVKHDIKAVSRSSLEHSCAHFVESTSPGC